jgi:hypothetical protein
MDTETGGEKERPRDDEIQAFHNQIRAADAEKLEFVGDKVRFLFPCLVLSQGAFADRISHRIVHWLCLCCPWSWQRCGSH